MATNGFWIAKCISIQFSNIDLAGAEAFIVISEARRCYESEFGWRDAIYGSAIAQSTAYLQMPSVQGRVPFQTRAPLYLQAFQQSFKAQINTSMETDEIFVQALC